jgi:predicted nicotinamide N-methyase
VSLTPGALLRDATRIQSAPLVPELRFHLACDTVEIWRKTEEALGQAGLPPPFWAFAWAGGQALARHLLDHAELVAGRTVFDFACGGAIAGVAAAKAGAARVEASEIDPFAVHAARTNAVLNGVQIVAEEADLVGEDRGWDVVLAGDVFYEGDGGARIGAWLEGLAARGALVLIGDPGRWFLPKDKLEILARYRAEVSRDLEDRDVTLAKVWRFRQA